MSGRTAPSRSRPPRSLAVSFLVASIALLVANGVLYLSLGHSPWNAVGALVSAYAMWRGWKELRQ